MKRIWIDACLTAAIAALLGLPIAGAKTVDGINGLQVEWHVTDVAFATLFVFFARFSFLLIKGNHPREGTACGLLLLCTGFLAPLPSHFLKVAAIIGGSLLCLFALYVLLSLKIRGSRGELSPLSQKAADQGFHWGALKVPASWLHFWSDKRLSLIVSLIMIVFPLTPLANRYSMDVAIMVLTYVMLAWGLNISVGFAGLLDLGYVAFYAIGAYSYALLAPDLGIGFWLGLPLSGLIAAGVGVLLGFPVLRLRGDYFAIVTLGFGEIVRLIATNWASLTGGPNGISEIERPTLFGLEFARVPSAGHQSFQNFFGLPYDAIQRVTFFYYVILILAAAVGLATARLRTLPLGRAWEAFREDELACASLGINRTRIKLAAYGLGAFIAGLAGAFFAARQSFISPESFTFQESATILAIVILGGVGSPLGIFCAAIFIIGVPELFRDLEQYRMLAFGAGMVLIMVTRPGGMTAKRRPTVLLHPAHPHLK